jgi:recombination protein RecA
MYNEGISKVGDILDLGVEFDVIEKRGSFYNYGDTRLGQGRENAKEFLRNEREMAAAIDTKIRESVGLPINLAPKPDAEAKGVEPIAPVPIATPKPDLDGVAAA